MISDTNSIFPESSGAAWTAFSRLSLSEPATRAGLTWYRGRGWGWTYYMMEAEREVRKSKPDGDNNSGGEWGCVIFLVILAATAFSQGSGNLFFVLLLVIVVWAVSLIREK